MAYNSMSLHPNHMIKSLSCRQEARLQIILLLLSMVLTYTCAIFKTTKTHKTLHQFCGSLYVGGIGLQIRIETHLTFLPIYSGVSHAKPRKPKYDLFRSQTCNKEVMLMTFFANFYFKSDLWVMLPASFRLPSILYKEMG